MSDNTFSVQRFRALPTEIHVMLVGTPVSYTHLTLPTILRV